VPDKLMDNKKQNRALNLSIIDGSLSAIMGSLCGGIFLMGFVLKVLKADPGKIGLLASLPMFANLIQLFGSYIIEKTGKSKLLCAVSIGISRVLWLLIVLLPLKIFAPVADFRIWIVVFVIGISSIFGALAGVGWISWMSDLVPANIRGAYFGKRNMITSFFGMIFVLIGGRFIKFWELKYTESNPLGFIIIFAIGLIAGLSSLIFLTSIPEPDKPQKQQTTVFSFSKFLSPLKDSNFIKLIIFVSMWIFAINIAAPFYGVYMINILKIDFSALTIFGTAATIATLVMMKIWGPITDKLGNKPVVIVSSFVLVIVPFIWITALPGLYYIPVLLAHILSGAFMAGAGLSQFNILIKLAPQDGRSIYLALFAAITGLIGAVAPIAGGGISKIMENFSFSILTYTVTNLHFLFLLSSILIIISIVLAIRIKEEGSSTPVAVVLQLKNDLNPQAGIFGAADFLMVSVDKGESILKKIDSKTDELAGKSEESIKNIVDKGEKLIDKPIKKIKDFLKDDE
jgi:MFS family permease